jgi:hypothetical protein
VKAGGARGRRTFHLGLYRDRVRDAARAALLHAAHARSSPLRMGIRPRTPGPAARGARVCLGPGDCACHVRFSVGRAVTRIRWVV